MFHFSEKLFTLIAIFSCLFFYLVSCGNNNTAVPTVPTPSGGFQQFVSDSQKMTPENFVTWWNDSERYNGWKFSYYNENGLKWPDTDTAEQIYNSHVINCYRISLLLQFIYSGELIFVSQPTSNYDHYYLKLPNGDIIDNNGLTLKYKVVN